MSLVVGVWLVLGLLIGGFEFWAVKTDRQLTITNQIRQHPHLAILVSFAIFSLFGYSLGVGGS